ncbi:MAG: hypothetical protein HRT52_16070 [Colwellia sp.]|nr:hypothetical protein [Colwellia sp.]
MTNFFQQYTTNSLISFINKSISKSEFSLSMPSIIRLMVLSSLLSTSLLTTTSYAADEENKLKPLASVSHGGFKKDINEAMVTTIIKQNHQSLFSDQVIGKATGKNRAVTTNNNKLNLKNNNGDSLSPSKSRSFDHEFGIYSAFTFLEDDFDGDGYYQTFSVTFDADVYSHTSNYDSEVYAELYLSKDGVNWLHYYSTDNFIIHADTDEDQYEVITTLLDGYYAGHYDVLIDLYEVGYEGIVATFSSDDVNGEDLYALPLESSDFDTPYVEEVHVHHRSGGSMSIWLSLFIFFVVGLRLAKKNS